LGYFVTLQMGHAEIYQHTKFEVSSITRSNLGRGSQSFKIRSNDHYHAIL